MATFYIAATVTRWREHNLVRDILTEGGHEITMDWTSHGNNGSLRGQTQAAWERAAADEAEGVAGAQFFVGLLPGGFGTNGEVGMSALLKMPTFLHSTDPRLFDCGQEGLTTTFYWHPGARRYTDLSLEAFAHEVLRQVDLLDLD